VVARLVVEMRAMRGAIKLAIVLVATAAMAWSCLFIYWHLKIGNAIRRLDADTESPGMTGQDAFEVLRHDAGCRALPYLVASLDPKRTPAFLERATLLIAIEIEPPPYKGPNWMGSTEQSRPWYIAQTDSPEERRRKCDLVREYWKLKGSTHHQVWRIWSKACVPNE